MKYMRTKLFTIILVFFASGCATDISRTSEYQNIINRELVLNRDVMLYEQDRDPVTHKSLSRGTLFELDPDTNLEYLESFKYYDRYSVFKGAPLRISKVIKARGKSWMEIHSYGEIYVELIDQWVPFNFEKWEDDNDRHEPWDY